MSSTLAVLPPPRPSLRGPFRLAIAMLVVTTITILWGAMTTSTGSGLAYRTWPDSDGELMPVSSYTTLAGFLEHFHRLFGATAGLLTIWLAVWAQMRAVAGAVRKVAWFALGLIIVQGLIGGVGVLKGLPALTSVAHGTLAQLTLATFACLAYQLSDRHRDTPRVTTIAPGSGRKLMVFAVAMLVVQTVLGGVARHTNSPHALWTHVGNALVVFLVAAIATAFAGGKLGDTRGVKGLSRWLVLLLIAQIALGFVALGIRNPAGKTPDNVARLVPALVISVHVLFGALLTVLTATLAAHVFRATRAPAGDVTPAAEGTT